MTEHRDNKADLFNTSDLPANPKQREILLSWNDMGKSIFSFTGANRSGGTVLGTILSMATLFGEWPWNGEKLNFHHNQPRKVRIVGMNWRHVELILVPTMEAWWPEDRPFKSKKNQMGVIANWTDVKTGSVLEFISSNSGIDQFEDWQGDLVYYSGIPRREVRIACALGLVPLMGKEFFASHVTGVRPWFSQDVLNSLSTKVFNVHVSIRDNVGYGLTEEGVSQFEAMLTAEEKMERIDGIPVETGP